MPHEFFPKDCLK